MRQNKQFSDLVNAALMAGVSIYIAELNAVSTKKAMRTATKFMLSVLGPDSFSRDSIREKLRRIHARIQQGETIEQALRDKRKDHFAPGEDVPATADLDFGPDELNDHDPD